MTILGICLGGEGSEDRAEGMKEFEMGGGVVFLHDTKSP
jgi:hypothetical protein